MARRWPMVLKVVPHRCLYCEAVITETPRKHCDTEACILANQADCRTKLRLIISKAHACRGCLATMPEDYREKRCPRCTLAHEKLVKRARRMAAKKAREAFVKQQAMLAIVNARLAREARKKAIFEREQLQRQREAAGLERYRGHRPLPEQIPTEYV